MITQTEQLEQTLEAQVAHDRELALLALLEGDKPITANEIMEALGGISAGSMFVKGGIRESEDPLIHVVGLHDASVGMGQEGDPVIILKGKTPDAPDGLASVAINAHVPFELGIPLQTNS